MMPDTPKTQALDFVRYLQTAIDFTQEGPPECGVVEVASTAIPPTLTTGLAIMTVNCADGARFFISVVKLLDAPTTAPGPVDVGQTADAAQPTMNPRNGEEDADGDAIGRMMGENR